MPKYSKLFYTLASITSISLISCGGNTSSKQSVPSDSVTIHEVEHITAKVETIDLRETFSTTIEAKAKNNISAQTGGRLSKLLVAIGDRVNMGQIIAQLDATQLSTAQIQLNDAKTAFARMDELYKVGGVSKAQWEQAKSTMAIAQEQVNNLLTNTSLRSPIQGVVTQKNYDNGDMTSPTLPVVVVEQINPVKATIHVSETHYKLLRRGLKASLTVDALSNSSFSGQVSNVYPTIDSRSHTVTVEVEFANNDLSLRPGMYGNITLELGKQEALLIPEKAVQRSVGAGAKYVYVIEQGKAIYRVVQLGQKLGNMQEITAGLNQGDEVITSAQVQLTNGALVK